jgi:hypothetical protein
MIISAAGRADATCHESDALDLGQQRDERQTVLVEVPCVGSLPEWPSGTRKIGHV